MSSGLFKIASSHYISLARCASLVKEFLGGFFNIFIIFETQKMGKKASLSETKRSQIVILHKEWF